MYIILLLVIIGFVILLGFLLAPGMSGRRKVRRFLGVRWAHRGLHDRKKGIHLRHFGKQWKEDAGLSWMYI